MALVERVKDADHVSLDDAILLVALLDHQRYRYAVLNMQDREWILLRSGIRRRIVENNRSAVAEHLARDALSGSHSEYGQAVFLDAVCRRDARQLASLAVVEHDHDPLRLEDHGDPLDEASQGHVRFVDGSDLDGRLDWRFGPLRSQEPLLIQLLLGFQRSNTLQRGVQFLTQIVLSVFFAIRAHCRRCSNRISHRI